MSSAGSSEQGLWENGSQGPPHRVPPQPQCSSQTQGDGQHWQSCSHQSSSHLSLNRDFL